MYHLQISVRLPKGQEGIMQDNELFETIELARAAAENSIQTGIWTGPDNLVLISATSITAISIMGDLIVPGPGGSAPEMQ